jgi:hypothetical protein
MLTKMGKCIQLYLVVRENSNFAGCLEMKTIGLYGLIRSDADQKFFNEFTLWR